MELFPNDLALPAGFSYRPEFITPREEQELLAAIAGIELHVFNFRGYEAKRRVASFGYHYNFENRKLSEGQCIPPVFDWLIQNISAETRIEKEAFAELLVTEYPAGSVINWHRDAHPFEVIAGISLQSDCTLRLRPHEKAKQGRGSIVSLEVTRRSLYVISGEARASWEHSISPVQRQRFSITLRTLRKDVAE